MQSNLNCFANNCTFNKSNTCYATHIKVEGFEATVTPETYCDTFRNKDSFSLSNYTGETSVTSTQDISCSASKCKYNVNEVCNATHVDINFENASCETFITK